MTVAILGIISGLSLLILSTAILVVVCRVCRTYCMSDRARKSMREVMSLGESEFNRRMNYLPYRTSRLAKDLYDGKRLRLGHARHHGGGHQGDGAHNHTDLLTQLREIITAFYVRS